MKNGFLLLPEGGTIPQKATRIISLVPSQTELLAYFGLDKEVIGITKFCIHPQEWFRNKTRIGGPKKLQIEKIKVLQPDLIIANKEENIREDINCLAQDVPVYVSDIRTLEDALNMIEDVGDLTARTAEAGDLIRKISRAFKKLSTTKLPPLRTAYFIWKNPWMAVGKHTFIHEMMKLGGLENVFQNEERYPEFSLETLKHLHPELILLSSEPYPFQQKHKQDLQLHFPDCQIVLVDGEPFCWYGSRLLGTPDYLIELKEKLRKDDGCAGFKR